MRNIAGVGFVLTGIGVLLCFANSAGFVKFMKLRSLVRHGVEGEAVSDLQEWISSGHRVYYHVRIPGAPPQDTPPQFIEVGRSPGGRWARLFRWCTTVESRSAKTGSLAEIDSSEERGMVMFFWVRG